jgi:pullulanase
VQHKAVFDYYKNLIALRKAHPAFRMTSGEEVRKHLSFKRVEDGFITYRINGHANGDPWKNILVIYNAKDKPVDFQLQGSWILAVQGDIFTVENGKKIKNSIIIPPISMLVAYQE